MSDTVQRAAALLLEVRRDLSKRIKDLPEDLRPKDAAAAYAIQHAVARALGPIGGWKVSPKQPDGGCFCGALPANLVIPGPTKLYSSEYPQRGIEAEVAVRIAKDLPPRATPYTREEVAAAISAFLPVIEVLQSRYIESGEVAMESGLADMQGNGALVFGEPVADWQAVDLAAESVTQTVDGEENASRTGMPGGDLLGEVVWLANVGSVWAGGLKAGQIVTCGSWTGAKRVGPKAHVQVVFSTVGKIAVDFA